MNYAVLFLIVLNKMNYIRWDKDHKFTELIANLTERQKIKDNRHMVQADAFLGAHFQTKNTATSTVTWKKFSKGIPNRNT